MGILNFIQHHKILEFMPDYILYGLAFYFALKILDFTSGLTRTWTKKEKFQSSIMREGIGRWVGEILGLAMLIMVDLFFGLKWALTTALLLLLTVKEIGSIKENLDKLGVTFPENFQNFLEKLIGGGGKQ